MIYLSDDSSVSGFRPSEMESVQDSGISSSILAERVTFVLLQLLKFIETEIINDGIGDRTQATRDVIFRKLYK